MVVRARSLSFIRSRGDPVTTTITLTPTLTLNVADRRITQTSVDSVWATITQHIRATGRTTQVAVLDGSQLLRLWELAPDGTRTAIEIDPTSAVDSRAFRLTLSPWMMSVPLDSGPDVREVSTLAVARAQATDAATAGGVELILQTVGTDEDAAEIIEPAAPEPITAEHPLEDDPDEDLFDELADEEAAPDEATRRFRRRAVAGSAALGLVLIGSIAAGSWAMLNGPDSSNPQSTQAASPSADAAATAEPSETATAIVSQALAPAGFSGTPSWEVVGATDQSSGMTSSGGHVGAVSARALDIVSTEGGSVTDSITLPVSPEVGPRPLGNSDDGALIMAADGRVMTWSEDRGLVDSKISEDDRLVLRGGTAFTVPHNDDTRPDSIQLLTNDGFRKVKSPGASASPIAPADDSGFLWASSADGGSIIHADRSGETQATTRLIGPSKGTTISKWLGATGDHVAVIWSNDGSGSVLAVHDAETGKVVDTADLGATGAGAGMQVVPSIDGSHIIAGSTLVDLDAGKVIDSVDTGSSSRQSVEAVPGGWISAQADGTQMLISDDGESMSSPQSAESLLGLTDDGAIVVDHRGSVAAFDPAPESS